MKNVHSVKAYFNYYFWYYFYSSSDLCCHKLAGSNVKKYVVGGL
jgi:hypothetical protein